MISPALAAQRFLISLLAGAVLGVYYGFLRPLRPKHTVLSDLLFLPGAFYTLLYIAFGHKSNCTFVPDLYSLLKAHLPQLIAHSLKIFWANMVR